MVDNNYNLIDEKWLPVVKKDGSNSFVSLQDLFLDKEKNIVDLALNPYERISVFRFLIGLALAALDETTRPKDEESWIKTLDVITDGKTILKYLVYWHEKFYLFGENAFMQPNCVSAIGGETSLTKIFLKIPSGNNQLVFHHQVQDEFKVDNTGDIFIAFLTSQNFSAPGTYPKCKWDGVDTPSSGVNSSPCRECSMLQGFLLSDSLLETIWLNLLTDKIVSLIPNVTWGRPIWEYDDINRNTIKGYEETIFGHLIPFSRVIKLKEGCNKILFGEALKYSTLPNYRDPFATVIIKKDGGQTYLPTRFDKKPWRDLNSVLLISSNKRNISGPLHFNRIHMVEKDVRVWVGGFETEKARDIDSLDWCFIFPNGLKDTDFLVIYNQCIDYANDISSKLEKAVDDFTMEVWKSNKGQYKETAVRFFWKKLDSKTSLLSSLLSDFTTQKKEEWENVVKKTASEAYEFACPHLNANSLISFVKHKVKFGDKDGRKNI